MQHDSLVSLICQRVSYPRLDEPAPDAATLEQVFKAAFRAPDHRMLRPWRYLTIRGEARVELGGALRDIALEDDPKLSELQQDKFLNMPLRAPLIIVGISRNYNHPKVPNAEQEISCGVGLGYMLLALQEQGYGGIWRTGKLAHDSRVKSVLGVKPAESIVGFLYVGTPQGDAKPILDLDVEDFVEEWHSAK